MEIYLTAKQLLNGLIQQAVQEGVSQEEVVYKIAKAVDDSFRAKHAAQFNRENEDFE